jgi:hypothetical protein
VKQWPGGLSPKYNPPVEKSNCAAADLILKDRSYSDYSLFSSSLPASDFSVLSLPT